MLPKFFALALLPLAVVAQSPTTSDSSTTPSSSSSSTSSTSSSTTRTSTLTTTKVVSGTTTATTTTSGTGGGAGGLTPCITDCSQAAAVKNGCVTFSNVTCVCVSAQFQSDAGTCIKQFCPDQLQTALQFQSSACTGKTATGSANTTPFTQTNLASLTATGAQTTNTAPGGANTTGTGGNTTQTSPSAGQIAAVSYGGVFTAMAVALFGGVLGSGLVL